AQFVGGPDRLAAGTLAGAVFRRLAARARMVRTLRHDALHGFSRVRRGNWIAGTACDARMGPESLRQRVQRQRQRLSARMGFSDHSNHITVRSRRIHDEADTRTGLPSEGLRTSGLRFANPWSDARGCQGLAHGSDRTSDARSNRRGSGHIRLQNVPRTDGSLRSLAGLPRARALRAHDTA